MLPAWPPKPLIPSPILALTAHAGEGDRERYLQAGMDGYISKPIRRKELFEAIDRAVATEVKR